MVLSKLTQEEITSRLSALEGWALLNGLLVKQFVFNDFVTAIKFVNAVAHIAEDIGHHPDIAVQYNKVKISTVTHDAGGITAQDFDLAVHAENMAQVL